MRSWRRSTRPTASPSKLRRRSTVKGQPQQNVSATSQPPDNEDDADDDEGGDGDNEGENGDENDENGGGADEAYGAAREPLWYIPLPDLKDIYVAADYAWDKIPRLFIQVFVQREGLGYTVKGGCLVEGDFRSSRPVTEEVPEAWRRADADLQKYIEWMRMMH